MLKVNLIIDKEFNKNRVVVVSKRKYKELFGEDVNNLDIRIKDGIIYGIIETEEYSMDTFRYSWSSNTF